MTTHPHTPPTTGAPVAIHTEAVASDNTPVTAVTPDTVRPPADHTVDQVATEPAPTDAPDTATSVTAATTCGCDDPTEPIPVATPTPGAAVPARLDAQPGRPAGRPPGERVLTALFTTACGVFFLAGVGRWIAYLYCGATVSPAVWADQSLASPASPGSLAWLAGVVVLAAPAGPPGASITLEQLLSNVQWFIAGVLVSLTVTYLLIAFVRLITARGESEEYEKGKQALRSAFKGFLGAMLTPMLIGILQSLIQVQGGRPS